MVTPTAPRVPEAPGALERWLFAALCAALAAYWAAQYHPFVLPNNDYPSFERTAESLAALELPKDFQRMPVFPALMGVVAPLVPGRHPYLHAALGLNLALALGSLVLLFRLAARSFGHGALLAPLCFASATWPRGSRSFRPASMFASLPMAMDSRSARSTAFRRVPSSLDMLAACSPKKTSLSLPNRWPASWLSNLGPISWPSAPAPVATKSGPPWLRPAAKTDFTCRAFARIRS